jgi:hypothetical protein
MRKDSKSGEAVEGFEGGQVEQLSALLGVQRGWIVALVRAA